MNAPRPEPLEYRQDAPGAGARSKPITDAHAAWVARKRRERVGLPLRPCDREQLAEQLEDL